MKELSSENLQDVLWETLQKVKDRKLKPNEANAVTFAAKEIVNMARLELQWKAITQKGLEVAPKLLATKRR